MKKLRVAIVQTSAGRDVDRNIRKIEGLLSGLRSTDIVVLPEVFSMRGSSEDYRNTAQPLSGPIVRRVGDLARRKSVSILAGSIIESDGKRTYNTSVLLDRRGRITATYRKIHLFEAHLEDGRHIREAEAYDAGRSPVLANVEGWPVGLGICYDLRFPELFRNYAARGAALLLIPSNFTQRTGRDHWEVLLRARAIENQCFVVAPNQCGRNTATGVVSHGHSMAVGPWGEVLCEAAGRATVLTVELDPGTLKRTRCRIPVLKHMVLK